MFIGIFILNHFSLFSRRKLSGGFTIYYSPFPLYAILVGNLYFQGFLGAFVFLISLFFLPAL